jgi:alpha-acetolactate decarboxylase
MVGLVYYRALSGRAYQVAHDGTVRELGADVQTPFAVVTELPTDGAFPSTELSEEQYQ